MTARTRCLLPGSVLLASGLLFGCAQTLPTDVAWSSKRPAMANLPEVEHLNLRDEAMAVLNDALASEYALARANAVEALHPAPEIAIEAARRLLGDENRGVRFVAVMTLAKLDARQYAHLILPLLDDPSDSVCAAAIYALHSMGESPDLTPLARMVRSDDPEVRANAAMILGQLGNPSAAPMLRQAVGEGMELARPGQPRVVDLQIAEALVKLGDTEQIHAIRAGLFPTHEYQELAVLASQALGRLQDMRSIAALMGLIEATGPDRRPAEVRLAAAVALANLGEAVPAAVAREYVAAQRPELRSQVALTLGEIGDRSALADLSLLLDDPNPIVRVAAAGAVLRLEERLGSPKPH